MQRPTVYDAIGQLLRSIQGNQYAAQQQAQQNATQAQQQAREDEQTRYDRSQQESQDAYDRQQDALDQQNSAKEDQNQKIDDAVSRFHDLLTSDRAAGQAAFKQLDPSTQAVFIQRLGYDPSVLPPEPAPTPKPMTEYEKARINQENQRISIERGNKAQSNAKVAQEDQDKTFKSAVQPFNEQLGTLQGHWNTVSANQTMPPDQKRAALQALTSQMHDIVQKRDGMLQALQAQGRIKLQPINAQPQPAPATPPPNKPAPPAPVQPPPNQQQPKFAKTGLVHLSDGRTIRGGTNDGKTFYDLATGQPIQ